MLFGHTCGLQVLFMGYFKEKVRGLTSVLRDPGMWVPLSFSLLGVICQVAFLLGTLGHVETDKVSRISTFLWHKLGDRNKECLGCFP